MVKPYTLSLAMYKGMSRDLGWVHTGTNKATDAKIRESIYLVALEEYVDFPPCEKNDHLHTHTINAGVKTRLR